MGEIGTDENFGDKTGGDRHKFEKKSSLISHIFRNFFPIHLPSVNWKIIILPCLGSPSSGCTKAVQQPN
jgi:hypothetical protein